MIQEVKSTFEDVYSLYWERLYAFAFKMTSDRALSQNIIQDIFISVWEKDALSKIKDIESYLFQAVRFQVFKNYKNKNANKELIESKFEDFVLENTVAVDTILSEQINTVINKLPEKRKEIFLMNKLQDLSVEQIATELEISKQTVRNQLSSAVRQLRFDLKNTPYIILLITFFICKYVLY